MKTTTINTLYNILKELKETTQLQFDNLNKQLEEKYGATYLITAKVTKEEKKLFESLHEMLKIANEAFNDFCSHKWS